MITFEVIDHVGEKKPVEVPRGINLSLMEVLKASEYPVAATCGGMGLCATCHVEAVEGFEKLPSPCDTELDTLDQLPQSKAASRLACQIRIGENLNGAVFCLAN